MAKSSKRGVTVVSNRKSTGRGIVSGFGAGGQDKIVRVLNDAGEASVQTMQNVIATTPSALVEGKPNRIWSGKMINSVGYRVLNPSRGMYRLQTGWIGTEEDYFLWQDSGEPQNSREWPIKGMMMLFQGYVVARDEVRRGIERAKLLGK